MQEIRLPLNSSQIILALGAQSQGNFTYFSKGKVWFSEDFGDLAETQNYALFLKNLRGFLNQHPNPKIILCDLHPLFLTSQLAVKLSKKYHAKLFQIQHHHAHVFSAIGDRLIHDQHYTIPDTCISIACDGTGYADDGTIWGGEIIKISKANSQISNEIPNQKLKIERIGHLEHQTLLGGEKAIEEPARMLISILSKFMSKEEVFLIIKAYYSKNEFELLWNQLQQEYNCIETSSTARILDAVSLLLGFSQNKRSYKHEPIDKLEKNSSLTYDKLHTKIQISDSKYILPTTPLFKYLIKNLHTDKQRLAATAQSYIANGLWSIIEEYKKNNNHSFDVFFSGGMANNHILSSILASKGIYLNKKIPRGDAGISFGQITCFLLTNSGD